MRVIQYGRIHEVKLLRDNGDTVTVKGVSGNICDIAKKDIVRDCYFELTVDGSPVYAGVTKKNEIMIESSEDGTITSDEVRDLVGANGFNTCFSTPHKREFAEGCHFNNLLVSKREINDNTNNEVISEYFLSELRKSKKLLEEFLG